jgi:hypothetical protein
MTRRRIVLGVVALVVAAGVAFGIVTLLDDDDEAAGPPPSVSTTTVVARPDPEENPAAAELYDLVTEFPEKTLHATYQVTVTERPGVVSTIEIWQKDGKVRQDATIDDANGGTTKLAILDLEDRVVFCQQPPGGEYTCGLVSETQATAFDALRTNLLAEIEGQEVTVRDETINGRDVRCFSVESASAGELCATNDGILVRISAAEGSFELVDAEDDVDDDVFEPPATPGES